MLRLAFHTFADPTLSKMDDKHTVDGVSTQPLTPFHFMAIPTHIPVTQLNYMPTKQLIVTF